MNLEKSLFSLSLSLFQVSAPSLFDDGSSAPPSSQLKRPQVRCDSEKIARTVSQQINYARTMFEERTQAVKDDAKADEEE